MTALSSPHWCRSCTDNAPHRWPTPTLARQASIAGLNGVVRMQKLSRCLAWHSARQASAPGALKARWDTASYSATASSAKPRKGIPAQLFQFRKKVLKASMGRLRQSRGERLVELRIGAGGAEMVDGLAKIAAGRRNGLLKLLPGRLGEPAHQLLMYQIRLQGR